MALRKLYYSLPPSWRLLARRVYYFPHDLMYSLSDQKGVYPPPSSIFTGGGNFKETGDRFVKYFVEHGGLKLDDHVVDIGSGIGRMAIPLTGMLSQNANYDGFDLMPQGIDWCRENITSKYSNFNFHLIPLKNDLYKVEGISTLEYHFPLENQSTDFVFLISVFTHLQKEEVLHYLKEIHRMLKPGARCFATFFILDPKRKERNPNFRFKFNYEDYALMDEKVKAANVAFDKTFLFNSIENIGFQIANYLPGYWRNREAQDGHLDFQDILILQKD